MNGSSQSELNNPLDNPAPKDRLLTLKEAAEILEVSEEDLENFAAQGKVPAYKIGGEFLRFKKNQIEALRGRLKILKHQSVPIERLYADSEAREKTRYSIRERLRDFLYFNDFFILAAILIALLIFVIFGKR